MAKYDTEDISKAEQSGSNKENNPPKEANEEEDEWESCGSQEEENDEEYEYRVENPFNVTSSSSTLSTKPDTEASTTSSKPASVNGRSIHSGYHTAKRKLVSFYSNKDVRIRVLI